MSNIVNVGSIEEDIKILENLIVTLPNFHLGGSESIRNILQDYKRQKQINEEHQKINGELREQVKELEEENKENKKKYLALLIGQFPDTTETYKKYKKELQKLLQESENK